MCIRFLSLSLVHVHRPFDSFQAWESFFRAPPSGQYSKRGEKNWQREATVLSLYKNVAYLLKCHNSESSLLIQSQEDHQLVDLLIPLPICIGC